MRVYRLLIALFFCTALVLHAAKNEDKPVQKQEEAPQLSTEVEIQNAKNELVKIQKELSKGNSIWLKSYNSYMAYQEARKSLRDVKFRIEDLENRSQNVERKLELEALQAKQKVLTEQIELLKAQGASPFVSLLKPDEAGALPTITNPFQIVTGLSYVKRINSQYRDYILREEELQELIKLLERQVVLYKEITRLDSKADYEVELEATLLQVEKFKLALETLVSTAEVYEKRIESTEAKINKEIKDQIYKFLNITMMVAVLFLV